MNIGEIEDIVSELNIDLYERTGIDWTGFSFSGNGFGVVVEFLGEVVWNDDDDGRDFNNETGQYENLRDYLVREAKNLATLYAENL